MVEPEGELIAIRRGDQEPILLTRRGARALSDWVRAWARPRTRLKLWGRGEIEAEYGISKSTFRNWRKHPTFPKPLAKLSCGPVWEAEIVRAWARYDRRRPGRPRTHETRR